MWQRVSWKWKNVIDNCPSLWTSITIINRTEHTKSQLEKSKGLPVDIKILAGLSKHPGGDWTKLLVDNAHRWKSLVLDGYSLEFTEQIESSPLKLDHLNFQFVEIPHDCKLFNLIRPKLRKLHLGVVTIPHSFDPTLGLEELQLYDVYEQIEDGWATTLSASKFHQFLQTNPNLRILEIDEVADASPNDSGLQPVSLPRLENVTSLKSQVLHLFRAEHCVDVRFTVRSVAETPPLSAWTTFVHTLRRVERLKITVSDSYLSLRAVGGPYKVELLLDTSDAGDENMRNLVYSMLKDILDEAEKDTPIRARVDIALFAFKRWRSDFDVSFEILKLLQTPVCDFSSGKPHWRIPNLDTISMPHPGLPYCHLRAFVLARSNGTCSPITGIFTRSHAFDDKYCEEVLNNVMAYTLGVN
ncbi:hypothetical protein FRC01_012940 [Tulasnella sp. 417]|nr:hypothetical protein FRC01_012940 [Tulasnella sp. 417]